MFNPTCYEDQLKKTVSNRPKLFRAFDGKRILVTGSTGLIGSAVTDMLCCAGKYGLADVELYVASRKLEQLQKRFSFWESSSLNFIPYDTGMELHLGIEFDHIIHCAGNSHPADFGKQPVETIMDSILGVYHLLDYIRRDSRGGRMLYVSSSEVYGNREEKDEAWFREEDYGRVDILNARACYPSGKRAAEALCISHMKEYGTDVVIARPGHVYGPNMTERDSRAAAQFFRNALSGRDIVMKSDGRQLRSYCYVLDCATALLTVLTCGEKGSAYNISNRESVITIRQVAEEIAKQADCEVVYEVPTETEKRSYNLMDVSALDAGKLEGLGWHGDYNLQDGVKATLSALIGKM